MNITVFLLFFSFVFSLSSTWEREREREGVYKIGYKEKQSQSYLSYLNGFLWRIFLLLRALHLPGVLGFSSVRHEPCPTTNFLIIYFCWRKESPLPFWGLSQSFGFSLLPPGQGIFLGLLDVTQVPFFFHQVTKYKHLFFHSDLDLLLWDWPTFFHVLTAILWRLATVNSNTRVVVILFLSSQWDTTWQS